MADQATGLCRSCGAAIIWASLPSGKRIPLNAGRVRAYSLAPDGAGGQVAVSMAEPIYVSHFTTCPNASQHSGGGGFRG